MIKQRRFAKDQPCYVEGCDRLQGPRGAHGLCPRHYQRMQATGSPTGTSRTPAVDRFFNMVVEAEDGCWLWTGALDQSGYGMFSGRMRRPGRCVRSHIWAYEYFIAQVPSGLELDHTCHSYHPACKGGVACSHRRCCNPWHLDPVPNLVNTQRGRGAKRTHCPQGHGYTTENTYINPKGAQVCRVCAAAARARYERKKAA